MLSKWVEVQVPKAGIPCRVLSLHRRRGKRSTERRPVRMTGVQNLASPSAGGRGSWGFAFSAQAHESA